MNTKMIFFWGSGPALPLHPTSLGVYGASPRLLKS